ncbi:S-layer homology domain-containing protein [Intestinimonas sp.]|nr:S-layer homology domain-containing protein [Intestinimonas sp.]
MRNLKRALSLALASVMVMSMMVIGAGAANLDDFSDKEEIVNKEAVTVLTTLNVINGKDNGSYDPTGIVTRAEMAKIICVTLNGGSDPALGAATTHTYTDTVGHWAEPYIEYCTQLGIVAGKGDGTFDPNGTVTATEAAKMLLVSLGYNASFENMVGANWAVSTNVLANQNKLYAGLKIDVDAGLTRDNAAQMAYNALNCEMVGYTYALVTGPDGSLTSIPRVEKEDETLLSKKFGGVRVEGVVVRNEQTSNNFEGKTVIDITNGDELAKVGHNFVTTSGGTVNSKGTFEVSTDASLLGTSVFFYAVPSVASPNNTEKAVVLGSVMDSGKNVVVSTNASFGDDDINDFMDGEDIDLAKDEHGNNAYTTCVNGSEKTNGISDLTAQENGYEIKFIDNDNDGETEYVVQTTYGFGKVVRYDSDEKDGGLTIDSLPGSKDYKAEKVIGLADVAKGDYVVYNEMGGKLYVVKAETVTGKLETFKDNSKADNTDYYKANLTVDGTTYKFSGGKLDYNSRDGELKDPMDYTKNDAMGKEIVLYLDKFGYVAATSDVEAFTDYAYVANVRTNDDATAMSGSVRVYVVLPDGSEKSYIVNNFNGSDSFSAASIIPGNVYGYYITSDDKIDLTGANNIAFGTADQNVKHTSGDVTVLNDTTNTKIAVDSDTIFYYALLKSDKSGVKSVETYGGKDKAPSFDLIVGNGTTDLSGVRYVDRDNDGVAEALIVTTDKVTSANVLYLYRYVKSNGEYAIYDAVIDGKLVEGISVDSKATNLAKKPYNYTITSKGVYQLTETNSTFARTDFVKLADGKRVMLADGTEVKITDGTAMAEIDGGDTAIITNVSKNDYVTVVFDTENKAYGIYLLQAYSTDNKGILDIKEPGTTDLEKVNGKYQTTSTTIADIKGDLIVPVGSKVVIAASKPANLAAAVAATDVASLSAGNPYYIVVVSEDQSAYSVDELVILTGAAAPTFSTDLSASQTGYATLTVNATVTDGGTVSYQWYKKGVGGAEDEAVSGATSATYTPTEAGTYYVIATNTLSTGAKATAKSTACVVRAPADTAAPTVLTIAAGTGSGITADQGNLLTTSPKVTGIAGSTAKISYTVTADQYITITANGKPVVEEMQGSGDSKNFALTTANITGKTLEIKVVVTEDGHKNFEKTYTVAVEQTKAAAPTALALVGEQGTGATDAPTVASSGNLLNHSSNAVTVSSAEEGNTLKVTNTPSASTTVEYAIDGAGTDTTDAAYSIVAEDIGKTVTVTVTVTHAGYADLVLTYEITVTA